MTGDPHCGGSTGLLPAEGIKLDDGNQVLPNLFQEWAWDKWLKAWERSKLLAADCDKLIVILNGDLVDGNHHGTTQLVSANPAIQVRIAKAALSPIRDLQPDELYVVRGTAAHGGESGSIEEIIAEDIGAKPDPSTGSFSRWKLDIQVHDTWVQAFHHGRLGTRKWTEQNALHGLAWDIRTSYDSVGSKAPDLVFTAHQHGWGDSGLFSCPTRVVMSPGWQGATQYVHRTMIGKAGIVPVGMWVAIVEEGEEPVLTPVRFKASVQQPN